MVCEFADFCYAYSVLQSPDVHLPSCTDLVWQHLFVDRSPVSEAARGVLTTLQMLGLHKVCARMHAHTAVFTVALSEDVNTVFVQQEWQDRYSCLQIASSVLPTV